METETQTRAGVDVRPSYFPGRVIVTTADNYRQIALSVTELQSIVQQAYDRHGVVAQLWTDSTANADRAQSGCNGTYHCPSTGSHHFDCYAVQA